MPSQKLLNFCLIVAGLITCTYSVSAQKPMNGGFSADWVVTSAVNEAQGDSEYGKLYVTKDKIRIEKTIESKEHSMTSITIVRLDKNVLWIIVPQQNKYMEVPIKPEEKTEMQAKMGHDVSKLKLFGKIIGTKLINEQLADQYDLSTVKCKVYSFIFQSSNLPARVEQDCGVDGKSVTVYKNFRIDKPPSNLFDQPQGYENVLAGSEDKIDYSIRYEPKP